MKLVHSSWSQEQLEQDADLMERKISRIKRGDKTVHIRYIGNLLTDKDLENLEATLSTINYELSSFDESGIAKASSNNFASEVVLYLNDYTLQQTLLSGLITSAIWDSVKSIAFYTWHKIKDRTYFKATSKTVSESKASFSIKTKTFEFNTENLSEEVFERSLDKILDFLKEQEDNHNYSENRRFSNHIAVYNAGAEKWDVINLTPELLKAANNKIIKSISIEDFIKIEK